MPLAFNDDRNLYSPTELSGLRRTWDTPAVTTMQGIVLAIDGVRGNEGIFIYTVRCEHPVTGSEFTLYNVKERVDQFYQNQAGRIPIGAMVNVERRENGICEITKVEINPGQFPEPTSTIITSDAKNTHLEIESDSATLDVGNLRIASDKLGIELSANEWRKFIQDGKWGFEGPTLSLVSEHTDVPTSYEYLNLIDNINRDNIEDGVFYAAFWKGGESLDITVDFTSHAAPHSLTFQLPIQLSRLLRSDGSGVASKGNNNPVTPLSSVPEWGPPIAGVMGFLGTIYAFTNVTVQEITVTIPSGATSEVDLELKAGVSNIIDFANPIPSEIEFYKRAYQISDDSFSFPYKGGTLLGDTINFIPAPGFIAKDLSAIGMSNGTILDKGLAIGQSINKLMVLNSDDFEEQLSAIILPTIGRAAFRFASSPREQSNFSIPPTDLTTLFSKYVVKDDDGNATQLSKDIVSKVTATTFVLRAIASGYRPSKSSIYQLATIDLKKGYGWDV